MQRRTWLVSEPYHPELTGTGYYLTTLAEALASDRDVSVLCGQPTYASRGERAPRRERRNGVDIRRCRGTTLDKDVVAFRLVNLVTLGLAIFVAALRNFRPGDTAIVVTNPPTQPYLLLLACRLRRAQCVILVHDLYPDIAVAVGLVSARSTVVRTMRRTNRQLLRSADHVIVVGRDMQEVCADVSGLDLQHITVIANWADPSLRPDRSAGNSYRAAWGADDDTVVVLCAGNFGRPHDIEVLVAAAGRVIDEPRLLFVFLGHGVKRAWVEDEVARQTLSNVVVVDPEPREAQQQFLNAADVGVVPLVAGMWGVAVPSRVYNLMAVSVPILAIVEAGSEVDRIIEEDQVGWRVDPGDTDALVGVLRQMVEDPTHRLVAAEHAETASRRTGFHEAVTAYRATLAEVEAR